MEGGLALQQGEPSAELERTDGLTDGLVMAVETERGLLSGAKGNGALKKERENERPKKERKQLQKRACPRTMEGEIEFDCSSGSPRLFFFFFFFSSFFFFI